MSVSKAAREGWPFVAPVRTIRAFVTTISPVTYAVGTAAFFAASLFVLVDLVRTLEETSVRFDLVARAALPEPGGATALSAVATRAPSAEIVSLSGAGGEPANSLSGLLQRSLLAFGGALVATGAAYRRRPEGRESGSADGVAGDSLLSSIPMGVARWSSTGRLIACNDAYRSFVAGDTSQLVAGAPYAASVRRLVGSGSIRLVRETDTHRLLELTREDGHCLAIEERPLPGGEFISVVSDGTERHRAELRFSEVQEQQRQLARRYHEEKLRAEAASRSKTSFLAHLSHDIRTPLNHIIGFAELIRHQTYGPLGDKRYLDYVDTIKGSGEHLLQFFASILELAELDSGQRALRQERVFVDDLLDAAVSRFRPQAGRAGLALALGRSSGAVLSGDRFCLERMVDNLLDNAVRFTPAGGRVSVAAYAASDGVVVEITDTGIGMSPDRLSALSQPFAFGDASFTKDHIGAGLGVPIARAIAELSGGHLAIDSRPGLGTTVAISLPIETTAQVEAA